MNDKREIFGWTMYDWANSSFSVIVVTALLGPYIESLASSSTMPLRLFGLTIEPAAIYPFAVSFSVLAQVLFLPLLGTIADFTNLKKRMMMAFAYTGAVATMLLFLVQPAMPLGNNGAVVLGSILFIIANLSFGAAIVFYNAFLPEIASPDQRDAVSSRGFAIGYVGGGLALLLVLGLLTVMADTALAVRIGLGFAGAWWLVFAYLYPQQRLIVREPARQLPEGTGLFRFGVRRIFSTLAEMREKYPETLRYLIAYLIYNDGIQTVIVVAAAFAVSELGIDTQIVLLLVLVIQFVAFGGAFFFGWLAGQIGAKRAIMITLVIWSGISIYAYLLLVNVVQLFVLGALLALVLGGSQALSRSLFSQMIPPDHEAEYFGFYEISERGTSWIGPLFFGLAVQITGSQRIALLSLIIFFVVGLILLSRIDVRRAMLDSSNDPEGVVI